MGEAYRLAPGSTASFLVQVRNPYEGKVLADRRVDVRLNTPGSGDSEQVFSGTTDRDGLVRVQFPVPDEVADPSQVMEVTAETDTGQTTVTNDVYVGRVYNVLVSTDKPVYQPGQTIHMRGLALDSLDMHAADDQTMTVTVQDPQGNKLMRSELAHQPIWDCQRRFCPGQPGAQRRLHRDGRGGTGEQHAQRRGQAVYAAALRDYLQPGQTVLPARRNRHRRRGGALFLW